ncbi:cation transport protein-domain-containing protein [Cokeromyces recurvatus]|uniref:cation transport protein-domain-containing protein n=1 Tax=Cokeromyces recurvatus TaxID=90255 RepID=UPI002220A07E|nr:cation transport protein-domain-containing protein [Cokeromyces recurvatus]KAI7898077.1 cation transport protein-domain-containing protein [Cokeromyces recurvatus]
MEQDEHHPQNAINNHSIVFAENIGQQREMARRRLEHDRRFDEIMQGITDDQQPPNNDILIHKSQLTRQQRYRLGGAEYRAIDFLTHLVPLFYFGNVILFSFLTRIYIACSNYAQGVLRTSNNKPINPWLFSFFSSMSSFNNLGLIPLDASMVPFQSAPCMLILSMLLILMGNTAYAICLRFIIWVLYKMTPKSYVIRRETFRYLLDHPRRCYTTLFPATQTRWLLIVLIGITMVEFMAFVVLNYWLPVLKGIDWGSRVLDGLFQSVATRNAGYAVVDLMKLNPGTQIIFIVAMYISVYPVAISMRNSNVYQERALGIYSNQDENMEYLEMSSSSAHRQLKRHSTMSSIATTSRKILRKPNFFVMTQIQHQLTSEICWVIASIFAICVIESEAILSVSPITMSSIIYECVSAFGNVGASLGYPNTSTSQSQQYHTLSLPASIDRAVLLPSEQLEQKEKEDHMIRRKNASIDGYECSIFYDNSV